ncbi:MetS family NSS transporter small subunit [Pasteurella multocida]
MIIWGGLILSVSRLPKE